MKPSFADLKEMGEGKYEGDLEFTMGGDWIVTVRATMADSETVEKVFDVRGVVVQ
jgi:3-keto-L-gulonate-6-phosphate decarboxylase